MTSSPSSHFKSVFSFQTSPTSRLDSFASRPSEMHFIHYNKVLVFRNGVNDHSDAIAQISLSQYRQNFLNDGLQHSVKVLYYPGRLQLFLDGSQTPLLVVDVDLNDLGILDSSGKAWMGFTSSTGLVSENHDLLRWKFCQYPECSPL